MCAHAVAWIQQISLTPIELPPVQLAAFRLLLEQALAPVPYSAHACSIGDFDHPGKNAAIEVVEDQAALAAARSFRLRKQPESAGKNEGDPARFSPNTPPIRCHPCDAMKPFRP